MQPAALFDHLKQIVPPDDALRMVQAKFPSFAPPVVRRVIVPRSVEPEEIGDLSVLARDVITRKSHELAADVLWKAIHRDHPKVMRELHELGKRRRAQGLDGPTVVFP